MRCLSALVLISALAAAETFPPGDYSDIGRVVRRAAGQYDLFDGNGCLLQLPDKLAAQLKPHLGKTVRLDYTRVEYKEGELWDSAGSPIGKIRKITELPALDVAIAIEAPKKPFDLSEPVEVRVTIAGLATTRHKIDPNDIEINLLHDYRTQLSYRPTEEAKRKLIPGQPLVLTMRFDRMGVPGVYDAIAVLGATSDRPVLSDMVRVAIRMPKDFEAETAALRAWLPRAEPMQRIKIAERLIERGDHGGVDEIIELLAKQTRLYSNYSAYAFVWKHGGSRGEKLMLAILQRQTNQDSALRAMESVYLSPRALAYLRTWLADKRETSKNTSGWCERPRICDVIAGWLMGYTKGKMKFPNGGTLAERDTAVAKVVAQLESDPKFFSVLARKR